MAESAHQGGVGSRAPASAVDAPVLVTGFEPFADAATNPSGDAVRALATSWAGPGRLVAEVLPVTFAGAAPRVLALLDEHRPAAVLAVGLAEGRDAITPERVAVNLADARIPDNAGAQPRDEPVAPDGPAAYFATAPVKHIAAALLAAGIPAAVSHTAGTFVCNHVFYAALHHLHRTGRPHVPATFLHVPTTAVVPLADQVTALRLAVRTLLDPPAAPPPPGGSIH